MNITERFEEADKERDRVSEQKKKEKEVETEKAEDLRKASLETFDESRKGKDTEGSESTSKRQRAIGSDTIQFLREKSRQDFEFRKEELEIKKKEQESRQQELELAKEQQKAFMTHLQDSHQIEKQNLIMVMQQQQQQGQLMMSLLEQLVNK